MKPITFVKTLVRTVPLAFLVLLFFIGSANGQIDVDFYHPADGDETILSTACIVGNVRLDSGRFDEMARFGQWPIFGYPMHGTMFTGLNDTLEITVGWYNHTQEPYKVSDIGYKEWYTPAVYMMNAVPGVAPERTADQLGYSVRGWYGGLRKKESIEELPPGTDGWLWTKINLWNLPVGMFQICMEPTGKNPADFHVNGGGFVYKYYAPQSLADTINAYEACFWRANIDSNLEAAREWADRILEINPTSVPGWWLKAYNAWDRGDTSEAKKDFDQAIEYLDKMADPALPDSTQRPLFDVERTYLDWLHIKLQYNRSRLGP